jgi:hypothetical protein
MNRSWGLARPRRGGRPPPRHRASGLEKAGWERLGWERLSAPNQYVPAGKTDTSR